MKIRVATRGSRLSLIQTQIVIDALKKVDPSLEFEIVIVKTRGDVHQDKPFHMIGGKGLFEKEVNLAVLEGKADIAVHSLKDVPSEVHPRLVLAMTPPRDPPYDVLVTREGKPRTLDELPAGAVIGTSSTRRRAMVKYYRPDLRLEYLRGNVDTRIRKLLEGKYDAIILAEAGVKRLGINIAYWRIPPKILVPPPAQGIIGVYTLADRRDLVELLREASDEKTMVMARAERAFLARAGGGCYVPLGGYSWVEGSTIKFHAALLDLEGRKRVDVEVEGDVEKPELVGIEAAEELKRKAKEAGLRL
ncbi:MAG TPA: hydroxymethylbilane synthase [Pyrodictium sp.]|nr:hydroxymethylbilane synthase [Pyrodictium sp.]